MTVPSIKTEYLERCIARLELALEHLGQHEAGEFMYEVFRSACVKEFELIVEQCERWFNYRDHRNDTAHLYGKDFAEKTLPLLPQFAIDARDIAMVVSEGTDE